MGFAFELSILLCDDKEITKLNEKYRNKKEATDVLSFPLIDFPQGPGTSQQAAARQSLRQIPGLSPAAFPALGDVVLSCPSCIRQAKAKSKGQGKIYKGKNKKKESSSKAVQTEFIQLLIHGILHLFGYNHESKKQDQIRMQKREKLLYSYVMENLYEGGYGKIL